MNGAATSRGVFVSLVSGVALLLAACGSDAKEPPRTEEEPGPTAEGGLVYAGVVKEFGFDQLRQEFVPLPGVEVCALDHDDVPCAQSNEGGAFEIRGLPKNTELVLAFTKDGYLPGARQFHTGETNYEMIAETVLGSVASVLAEAAAQGVEPGAQPAAPVVPGGVVQFFGVAPADGVAQVALLADYTVAMTDPDGEPVTCYQANGPLPCMPVYLGANGSPDPSLTRATSMGVGAFGIVPAGDYLLHYEHPTLPCNEHLIESGFDSDEPNAVRIRVIEGYVTSQVGMICQPGE